MKQRLCVYRVYLSKVIPQYIFIQQESLGTHYTEKKKQNIISPSEAMLILFLTI